LGEVVEEDVFCFGLSAGMWRDAFGVMLLALATLQAVDRKANGTMMTTGDKPPS
jgi:hypothetical protein